jgi:hypothetical protein
MGADDRRSAREKVILTAEVEETAAGSKFPVRVSNVSRYGALIVGAGLPPSETEIVFRCNGLEIAGWVAWSDADSAGLQFAEPIETEKLTHRLKPPAAGIVKDDRQGSEATRCRTKNAAPSRNGFDHLNTLPNVRIADFLVRGSGRAAANAYSLLKRILEESYIKDRTTRYSA